MLKNSSSSSSLSNHSEAGLTALPPFNIKSNVLMRVSYAQMQTRLPGRLKKAPTLSELHPHASYLYLTNSNVLIASAIIVVVPLTRHLLRTYYRPVGHTPSQALRPTILLSTLNP